MNNCSPCDKLQIALNFHLKVSSSSVTKHWFRTSTRPPSSLLEIARFDAWATFSTPCQWHNRQSQALSLVHEPQKGFRSHSPEVASSRAHAKLKLRLPLSSYFVPRILCHYTFPFVNQFSSLSISCSATSNMPSAVIFTQSSSYFIWLNFAPRVRSLLFRSCYSSFIGRVKNSDSCFLAEKFRFSLCYSWRGPRSDGNVTHRWSID